MGRSRQVKALTLSAAHQKRTCARVLSPVRPWHAVISVFSNADGPATQRAPPHVNHSFQPHINDPHYGARPYGTALFVSVGAHLPNAATRLLRRSWKQIAPGDEAKLLVTSLRISLLCLRWQRKCGRGMVGATVMESLHLLQNVIQDVPFCPATAGEQGACVHVWEAEEDPLEASERYRGCKSMWSCHPLNIKSVRLHECHLGLMTFMKMVGSVGR